MTLNEQKIVEIGKKSKEERWPYPKTFDAYAEAGVEGYECKIADFHTLFFGNGKSFKEVGPNFLEPLFPADKWDIEKLQTALKAVQKKETDYWTFVRQIAIAGVAYYRVDMAKRSVTYYGGAPGDAYTEQIP